MAEKLGRQEVMDRRGRTVSRQEIRCDCGRTLVCLLNTNPCECGRDYNMSGQLLAPRSQWGMETGEHPADVARDMDADEWEET